MLDLLHANQVLDAIEGAENKANRRAKAESKSR